MTSIPSNPGVPLLDLGREYADLLPELLDDISQTLQSGQLILGGRVQAFERDFAEYLGRKTVVGVNSGTDALTLALMALDVGLGDEVVTQANTFSATLMAIVNTGAQPVLVDAEADGFGMDIAAAQEAVTSRTKAIIPVHMLGAPARVDELADWSRQRGIAMIEDCAQAHGARIAGKPVGSFGDAGCFSFVATKVLGCAGDGGAVAVDRESLDSRLRRIRNLGQETRDHVVERGYNSRLDALQAVILSHKLRRLENSIERRRGIAKLYREGLETLVSIPSEREAHRNCYYALTILLPDRSTRDLLREHLDTHGIGHNVYYPVPAVAQPFLARLGHIYPAERFPRTHYLAETMVSLPISAYHSDGEIETVINAVRSFFGRPGTPAERSVS